MVVLDLNVVKSAVIMTEDIVVMVTDATLSTQDGHAKMFIVPTLIAVDLDTLKPVETVLAAFTSILTIDVYFLMSRLLVQKYFP